MWRSNDRMIVFVLNYEPLLMLQGMILIVGKLNIVSGNTKYGSPNIIHLRGI